MISKCKIIDEGKVVLKFRIIDGPTGPTPYMRAYELGIFEGSEEEWYESLIGPPVPVSDELGQSSEKAVSQKLLTDTVSVMQQANSAAVQAATQAAQHSQQSAQTAQEQAGQAAASQRAAAESVTTAGEKVTAAQEHAQTAGEQAGIATEKAEAAGQSSRQASEHAQSAGTAAQTATEQAGHAAEKAEAAEFSAQAANQTALDIAELADIATNKAGEASDSADAAARTAEGVQDIADDLASGVAEQIAHKLDKSSVKPVLGTSETDVMSQWAVTQHFRDLETAVNSVSEALVNDIGVQGEIGFGVGVCPLKYDGMSELPGTRLRGHDNYGNYQYKDGSAMVWVPAFYYRYGSVDSARHADYGPNAADVLPFSAFPNVIAANIAGYPLHRAFYDDGLIQPGVMTDKFQCSNNAGIASSIKGAAPMSTHGAHNPINALNGSPSNNFAGTIDAAKTRGEDFFPASPFITGMLALLSLAHAEAAASTAACAWYDPAGITNYPRGCNNNALGDHADSEISYESAGHETYPNAALAGSGLPFAKTTHNGQACGIADLNGNFWEVNPGLTVLDGNYYILKTSARMASLTSGLTTETDAWGALGVAANYDLLGESFGTLGTDPGANRAIGSAEQVLSGAVDGLEWAAAGAGIPALEGTGGTNLFGNDRFYDNNPQHMCTASGGSWSSSRNAGVWARYCYRSRANSNLNYSFRAALYLVRKSDSE